MHAENNQSEVGIYKGEGGMFCYRKQSCFMFNGSRNNCSTSHVLEEIGEKVPEKS